MRHITGREGIFHTEKLKNTSYKVWGFYPLKGRVGIISHTRLGPCIRVNTVRNIRWSNLIDLCIMPDSIPTWLVDVEIIPKK